MFMAALLKRAPNWKQPKCSSTGTWTHNLGTSAQQKQCKVEELKTLC